MGVPLLFRTPSKLADGDLVEIGGASVRLSVRPRARRVSLRVDAARREVVATAPNARRLSDALAFARARERWIAARLADLPPPQPFQPGVLIPLRGEACRLERAAMRVAPRLVPATPEEQARLIASGEGEAFARAVLRKLKCEALADLQARTLRHVRVLGLAPPQVSVADARGRWGSCRSGASPEDPGVIRYSWRLVCAPPEVLDYVAAHEAAHLVEPNHAPAFWAVVRRLYGDYAAPTSWLKREGAALHALGRG